MLTTNQIIERTKTVTRRLGWENLKPGDRLHACEKCMGLRRGEKVKRLAVIEVVRNTPERLCRMALEKDYGDKEASLEGFPELSGLQFVAMFCESMKCNSTDFVNRIEFKYVD
jgi:hypothetical protein